jgi:predicted permease
MSGLASLVWPGQVGHTSRMSVILPAVLPVFITALIGYGLAKANRPFDNKTITFLVAGVGTPALVFFNLAKTTIAPGALAEMAAATALAISSYLAAGAVALKALGLRQRTFLPSLAFPNAGNLGLPLALYAAGEEGLNYAIVIFAITSIVNLTAGQAIAAGRNSWLVVMKSPILPAVALGLLFAYGGVAIPLWASNTLELLSGLTIPLMLLMLGTSLAKIHVTTFGRAGVLSAVRIGMGVVAGFALAAAFGFTGAERIAFVLQCAMPVAVFNYVFAQMYDNEPGEVASLVVVSTLLSVATTPILLAVLAP